MRIGVVGGGAWGTALADLLASKGYDVDLWVFETDVRDQILEHRENRMFLPGFRLASNLIPHCELEPVIAGKSLLLLVVPSHVMRQTASRMAALVPARAILVSASKGIENQTLLTMTGVLDETLPHVPPGNLAALS